MVRRLIPRFWNSNARRCSSNCRRRRKNSAKRSSSSKVGFRRPRRRQLPVWPPRLPPLRRNKPAVQPPRPMGGLADVLPLIAGAYAGQQLIANRPAADGEVVYVNGRAEELDRIAHANAVLGQVGDVDD